MDITIKIDGHMVSVEISGEVADCCEQFKNKTENLSHKERGIGMSENLVST